MKEKSMGINGIINGIRTIVSLIFPLITYKYVSTVLGVDNLGRYQFSHSAIDYFVLLSALGISTYAIREGVAYRDSRQNLSKFVSEVFSINLISTFISYILLGVLLLISPKFYSYSSLILVLSINMIFTTLGCEYVFNTYEEYLYVAVRSLIMQLIALLMMFLFVKEEKDVVVYAFTVVLSCSGAQLISVFKLKKYCDIRFTINRGLLVHLTPILILFANSVATKVYVASDNIILGLLRDDHCVGLYTAAGKIYSVLKQTVRAIITVSVPRLASLWGKGLEDQFRKKANKIVCALITFCFPAAIGLFSLSREAILILFNAEFLEAQVPLQMLCFAFAFCTFNWFYFSCIMVPCKKDKEVVKATTVSAILNIVLNIILIPSYGATAAAFTTLLSEACSLFICMWETRNIYKPSINAKDIVNVLFGGLYILVVCLVIRHFVEDLWLKTILCVGISVPGYFGIQYFLGNTVVKSLIGLVLRKRKN